MRADQLQRGEVFEDRYRIDEALGRGGFAVVWAAIDLQTSRRVALKVLEPDERDDYSPTTRARFRREVDALARLESPHTVRLYSHGETATGLLYAVFEHVPGQDLREVLQQSPHLQPAVAEHILTQLLESLREAHRHGLIHRDLKPENVRVFEAGNDPWAAKLLDFGIARVDDDGHPNITKTGELIGTPRYMSPEQLTGRPLTPASDVYSLGMLLFEMLAGSAALQGGRWSDQLDRLHTGHVFAAPGLEHDAGRLFDLVRQMTARDVSKRLRTADAVLAALGRERPELGASSPGSARSSNGTLLVLGALITIVAAGLYVASSRSLETAVRAPGAHRALTEPAPPELPTSEGQNATTGLIPGCSFVSEPGKKTIEVPVGIFGKRAVEAVVYQPAVSHGRPLPAVVLFGAGRQEAEDVYRESRMERLAEANEVLLIVPRGKRDGTPVATKPWDGERGVRILDGLAEKLCVDPDRIYALGNGNGRHALPDAVCGGQVAAISLTNTRHGNFTDSAMLSCDAVPLIYIEPLQNPLRPKEGGPRPECRRGELTGEFGEMLPSLESYEDTLARWNECSSRAASTTQHGHTMTRWAGCEQPLRGWHVDGGANWVEDTAIADWGCDGPVAKNFSYGETMWAFFAEIDATIVGADAGSRVEAFAKAGFD